MVKVNFIKVFSIRYKKKIKEIFLLAIKKKFGNIKNNFYLNIKFVSKKEIKNLNDKFRKINKETDVLSFPNFEKNDLNIVINETDNIFLGDIAICKNIAICQAKNFKHSVKRELLFLSTHGILHLLGYDHIDKQEEKEMMRLTEEILFEVGVKK